MTASASIEGGDINEAGFNVFGLNEGKINLRRFTPIKTIAGIPVSLNVDLGFDLTMNLAGGASLGFNLGDVSIVGDDLVIEANYFSLNPIDWVPLTVPLLAVLDPFGIIFGSSPNYLEVKSYPSDVSYDNSAACVEINGEVQGIIKPTFTFGASLGVTGFESFAAAGVYFDLFGEAVGKIGATTGCFNNDTPSSPDVTTCLEANLGLNFPYVLLTGGGKPTSSGFFGKDFFTEYSVFKLALLGGFKTNLYKFPLDCNPYDGLNLGTGLSFVNAACDGDQVFINLEIQSTGNIDSDKFSLRIGDANLVDLNYDVPYTFILDDLGIELEGNSNVTFIVEDQLTGNVIKVDPIFIPDCNLESCSEFTDPSEDLPTYGDQTYCSFIPDIPGYSKRWIRDNMYYTSNAVGFDPLVDGRCWQDDEDNCKILGRLYTWRAANGPRRGNTINGWTGDICPRGYHVASLDEWQELIDATGGSGNYAQLMNESTPWLINNSSVNASGMGIYPYGWIPKSNPTSFADFGEKILFWTSTPVTPLNPEDPETDAYAIEFSEQFGAIEVKAVKEVGAYCKCIED